jgi:hypothetical protein
LNVFDRAGYFDTNFGIKFATLRAIEGLSLSIHGISKLGLGIVLERLWSVFAVEARFCILSQYGSESAF